LAVSVPEMRKVLYIRGGLVRQPHRHTLLKYTRPKRSLAQSFASTFQTRNRDEVEVEDNYFVDHDISFLQRVGRARYTHHAVPWVLKVD
jgi:hypothetical protein